MKKRFGKGWLAAAAAALLLSVSACGQNANTEELLSHGAAVLESAVDQLPSTAGSEAGSPAAESSTAESHAAGNTAESSKAASQTAGSGTFSLEGIPAYSGTPYTEVNGNKPFFTEAELTSAASSYEQYSDLDSLGRCGAAIASVGQDIMPTEDRGAIGQVKPSGWKTAKYDNVDGKYLYNRCHLIGYQLTAENANEKNLITGTRYLNVDGMLPFENMTADYVKETGNHVLYRVTPIFEGNNLVASGVLMEAESVEDQGAGLLFCVYVYNVQPGITIDYATGDSAEGDAGSIAAGAAQSQNAAGNAAGSTQAQNPQQTETAAASENGITQTYVLNTNSKKFHKPDCKSVVKMSEKNKKEFTGTREALIAEGYEPCKICNP